jgi:hypothetical protein
MTGLPDGRALLATLDAALATDSVERWRVTVSHEDGLAAAVGLNALLIAHRLGWEDVIAPRSRLARMCGQLGSTFPAEREAAYHHAVRLLMERRSRWSDYVRLPNEVKRAVIAMPQAASAPEGDWTRTVQVLRDRLEWRSGSEQERLATLETLLSGGGTITDDDAAWLRDLWWCDEMDDAGATP